MKHVEIDADHEASRLAFRLSLGAVLAALLPIAVAAARAIRQGWLPLDDNAVIAIRARDVLSSHHPLLGLWSSASVTLGTDLNHPGPLLFDWLALPARLFDGGAGLAFGIALLNGLAVVGIAVVAYRRGGPLLATAATAMAAGLCWTMGSELLFEPWHAHSVLLPFLCFLMLVWSITCGDLVALPWAAGVGSLVLQTHVSYGLLVPALGAWAVVGLVLELRRHRRRDPGSWPGLRRRALRAAAVAGLVLAVGWAQPLVEQFTSDGPGNLTRLAESPTSSAPTIGYDLGTRMFASVVSLPPWWVRPSFRDTLGPSSGWRPPSLLLVVTSLALLAGVVAWCAWDARGRRDRECFLAVATAVVGLLAGLATTGRTFRSSVGIAAGHFRWLWPLAAFVTFAVVSTLARRLARGPAPSTPLVGAFALATVVFAALNLPSSDQGKTTPDWPIAAARDLGRQLARLEDEGTLLVLPLFTDHYKTAVMAELQHRGIPFVVDDPGMIRQLGPSRRFTGTNARAALSLRIGDEARVAPPGARRVALHEGLTAEEQLELAALETRIDRYIRDGRLRLNRRGREALRNGDLPTLRRQSWRQSVDPEPLFSSRELVWAVRQDLLVLDDRWARRFERYAELRDRWDNETVAIFLQPLGAGTNPPDR
ncbi:MAG: hypothetical protein ACRDZ1_00115 [Acidimicrobiia bacterium]